jgi:hypothetical protein
VLVTAAGIITLLLFWLVLKYNPSEWAMAIKGLIWALIFCIPFWILVFKLIHLATLIFAA